MGVHSVWSENLVPLKILQAAGLKKKKKKRAWWTVLILDRHAHVGSLNLSLCTPDPPPDALLPVDDEEWNQGVCFSIEIIFNNVANTMSLWEWREPEPVRVGSAATLKVGRFARVVQVMNLLTISIRIVAEVDFDKPLAQDHLVQLDHTLKALSTLNVTEAELRSTLF
ncbi:hypothetical protein V8C42DRAFT_26958 [Trichoderma barbatum]